MFHFTLVFFYALPFNTKNKFTFASQSYVYPVFHQNWNLFAPLPTSNYSLIVEYHKDGVHHKNIFQEILIKHQSNRLAGYGPLLLIFSNTIHYFEKNTTLRTHLKGPMKNDAYFSMLEHEIKNYMISTESIEPQPLKIYLIVGDVKYSSRRIYYN